MSVEAIHCEGQGIGTTEYTSEQYLRLTFAVPLGDLLGIDPKIVGAVTLTIHESTLTDHWYHINTHLWNVLWLRRQEIPF